MNMENDVRGQNSATQATCIVNMENVRGQNSATQASKKLGVLHPVNHYGYIRATTRAN